MIITIFRYGQNGPGGDGMMMSRRPAAAPLQSPYSSQSYPSKFSGDLEKVVFKDPKTDAIKVFYVKTSNHHLNPKKLLYALSSVQSRKGSQVLAFNNTKYDQHFNKWFIPSEEKRKSSSSYYLRNALDNRILSPESAKAHDGHGGRNFFPELPFDNNGNNQIVRIIASSSSAATSSPLSSSSSATSPSTESTKKPSGINKSLQAPLISSSGVSSGSRDASSGVAASDASFAASEGVGGSLQSLSGSISSNSRSNQQNVNLNGKEVNRSLFNNNRKSSNNYLGNSNGISSNNSNNLIVLKPKITFDADDLELTKDFVINKINFCDDDLGATLDLLVVVTSAVTHFEARDAIRRTWGGFAVERGAKLLFLLGSPVLESADYQMLQGRVEKEEETFGDILQGSFVDNYYNLTLKTISLLRWVNETCDGVKYVLKIDDDMFVNMQMVVDFCETRTFSKAVIGKLARKWSPHHDPKSKWYVPETAFNGSIYPNFATGPAYMFSGDATRQLLETAISLTPIYLEDVYVTGIVADRAGIRRLNHALFKNVPLRVDACTFKRFITSHKHTPQQIINLWRIVYEPPATNCTVPRPAPVAAPQVKPKAVAGQQPSGQPQQMPVNPQAVVPAAAVPPAPVGPPKIGMLPPPATGPESKNLLMMKPVNAPQFAPQ